MARRILKMIRPNIMSLNKPVTAAMIYKQLKRKKKKQTV
jgi:hypothetical protein